LTRGASPFLGVRGRNTGGMVPHSGNHDPGGSCNLAAFPASQGRGFWLVEIRAERSSSSDWLAIDDEIEISVTVWQNQKFP